MARAREFDYDETLQTIEQEFWKRGYNATSMQDLVAATRVNAGSLFKSIGSKKDIYLAALERYAEKDSPKANLLKQFDLPLLEALRFLYDDVINRADGGPNPSGCYVSNHVTALSSTEADIAESAIGLMQGAQSLIRLRLTWARDKGELSAEADIDALAAFVFCILQGLYVLSASTKEIADMQRARDTALGVVETYILQVTDKDKRSRSTNKRSVSLKNNRKVQSLKEGNGIA